MRPKVPGILLCLAAATCAPAAPAPPEVPIAAGPPATGAIAAVLDDWHDAAAHADEARYFAHFTADAVFLGTDATERWDTAAFRAYAHPRFEAGKAWSFRSTRREIAVDPGGLVAWFDEDLDAPRLGPVRGSGVLVKRGAAWKISQYNLAVTVPNERFDAVKRAAAGAEPPPPPPPPPTASCTAGLHGIVRFSGKPPKLKAPKNRASVPSCKPKPIVHDAVLVKDGRLADVLVRIENGGVKGPFPPRDWAVVHEVDCTYQPRIQGAVRDQQVAFVNDDPTLNNVHTYRDGSSWFNQAQPKGAPPILKELADVGVVTLASDVMPWMRGFVVVTDHPFFTVTGSDGAFLIGGVPPGKYVIEAWHSIYGLKRATVEVRCANLAELAFEYTGTEAKPPENVGDLEGPL